MNSAVIDDIQVEGHSLRSGLTFAFGHSLSYSQFTHPLGVRSDIWKPSLM